MIVFNGLDNGDVALGFGMFSFFCSAEESDSRTKELVTCSSRLVVIYLPIGGALQFCIVTPGGAHDSNTTGL